MTVYICFYVLVLKGKVDATFPLIKPIFILLEGHFGLGCGPRTYFQGKVILMDEATNEHCCE